MECQEDLLILLATCKGYHFLLKLIESYYSSSELYTQNHIKYGVKIDEDKVKDYMDLSTTDCYMILNGKSQNLGEYSIKNASKDHNMALTLLKDWGKNV